MHHSFEPFQADGLRIVGISAKLPAALNSMFALSPGDARNFGNIYTRLAAAIPRPDVARLRLDPLVVDLRRQIATEAQDHAARLADVQAQLAHAQAGVTEGLEREADARRSLDRLEQRAADAEALAAERGR